MEALLTGSSGVLGHSLVPELVTAGDRLRLFDLVAPPSTLLAKLGDPESDAPRFAGRVEWTIAIGIVAVTALLVAIIVFAARIGLAIHRSLIELLHLLGAADEYIARQFQIHALWLGLRGAIIGGIAAAVTAMILEPAAGRLALPVPAVSSGILDWRLWLLLCVALVIAGGVAMVTARVTVLRQLARLP